DRRDREHLARRRVETVEPRLQGSLNERGNRELVFVDGQRPLAVLALERAALDEVADRLLEEERVAARALGEELRDRVRDLSPCCADCELAAGVRRKWPHLDLLVAMRIELARALSE